MTRNSRYSYTHQDDDIDHHKPGNQKVPPFLSSLFYLLESETLSETIRWSADGNSLIIFNPDELVRSDFFKENYKHGNFNSFVRQLNMYGFAKKKKVTPMEYSHPHFHRGHAELLIHIKRQSRDTPGRTDVFADEGDPTYLSLPEHIDLSQRFTPSDLLAVEASTKKRIADMVEKFESELEYLQRVQSKLRSCGSSSLNRTNTNDLKSCMPCGISELLDTSLLKALKINVDKDSEFLRISHVASSNGTPLPSTMDVKVSKRILSPEAFSVNLEGLPGQQQAPIKRSRTNQFDIPPAIRITVDSNVPLENLFAHDENADLLFKIGSVIIRNCTRKSSEASKVLSPEFHTIANFSNFDRNELLSGPKHGPAAGLHQYSSDMGMSQYSFPMGNPSLSSQNGAGGFNPMNSLSQGSPTQPNNFMHNNSYKMPVPSFNVPANSFPNRVPTVQELDYQMIGSSGKDPNISLNSMASFLHAQENPFGNAPSAKTMKTDEHPGYHSIPPCVSALAPQPSFGTMPPASITPSFPLRNSHEEDAAHALTRISSKPDDGALPASLSSGVVSVPTLERAKTFYNQ